jgi:hypothetical protein
MGVDAALQHFRVGRVPSGQVGGRNGEHCQIGIDVVE